MFTLVQLDVIPEMEPLAGRERVFVVSGAELIVEFQPDGVQRGDLEIGMVLSVKSTWRPGSARRLLVLGVVEREVSGVMLQTMSGIIERATPKPEVVERRRTVSKSITLMAEDWEVASGLGDGNLSAGVRAALRDVKQRQDGQAQGQVRDMHVWPTKWGEVNVVDLTDGRRVGIWPSGEIAVYDSEAHLWAHMTRMSE